MPAHLLAAAVTAIAAPPDRASTAVLDKVFAAVRDPRRPGCALSVVIVGKLVAKRTYGSANLEQPAPIRVDTVFEAGSVSKQVTAVAVAVLAARAPEA